MRIQALFLLLKILIVSDSDSNGLADPDPGRIELFPQKGKIMKCLHLKNSLSGWSWRLLLESEGPLTQGV